MANGVGVKSRLQALQIAYVFVSHLSLILFPVIPLPRYVNPLSKFLLSCLLSNIHVLTSAGIVRYREQVEKVNRLKEDTVRAIIKNSSDIVAFKDEVSKQLQYLRDFAEAN